MALVRFGECYLSIDGPWAEMNPFELGRFLALFLSLFYLFHAEKDVNLRRLFVLNGRCPKITFLSTNWVNSVLRGDT